jgi:hypothetical protein
MSNTNNKLVQDNNFFIVSGWMINKLGLKGNDLMVYSIIYGFSQDKTTKFSGSLAYLCQLTGAGRTAVIDALNRLREKGYIEKEVFTRNGVVLNKYSACEIIANRFPIEGDLENESESVRNPNLVDSESEPNSIVYSIVDNIEDNIVNSNLNLLDNNMREREEKNVVEEKPKHKYEKEKGFVSDLTNFYYPIDEILLPIEKNETNAKYRSKYPPLLPQWSHLIQKFEEMMAENMDNQANAQRAFEFENKDCIDWSKVRSCKGLVPVKKEDITLEYITELPHSNMATWLYLGLDYTLTGSSLTRMKFKEIFFAVYPLSYLTKQNPARLKVWLQPAATVPAYHKILLDLINEKTKK